MFLNNKYTNWYMSIVSSRQKMSRAKKNDGALHSHHIIPKSLGGSNHKANIVLLTPREHFICHRLLTKMTRGVQRRSMYCALVRFLGQNKDCKYSRSYESVVREYSKFMCGENNHFYGKRHKQESIEAMRDKLIGLMAGDKNPFYGKKHKESTKRVISESRKQRILVKYTDGTQKEYSDYGKFAEDIRMSLSLASKITREKFKYLLPKYNIEEIIKL